MIATQEKSSQSVRIYFAALRDEKNAVCLIIPKGDA
jgi:hypothetical protein